MVDQSPRSFDPDSVLVEEARFGCTALLLCTEIPPIFLL